MKASQLIEELQNLIDHGGDLDILLQGDSEGNSYNWINGAGITYVSEDLQNTYDNLIEASEYGDKDAKLVVVVYP